MEAVFRVFRPDGRLVRIEANNRLVGLAFLGYQRTAWGLHRASVSLNETGRSAHDAMAIEYNGLLADRTMEDAVAAAFCTTLRTAPGFRWALVTLSGVPAAWIDYCTRSRLTWRLLRKRQPAPVATFASLARPDLLQSLSRNTREQIRRSIRFLGRAHPLVVDRAMKREEALSWFVHFETIHTTAWHAKGKAGAFDNPHFAEFHRHLIDRTFESGGVDLLRLRAGNEVLGYLYNFKWRNVVYAYQSAFTIGSTDSRHRPGLVAHVLAMQLYREEGFVEYRFLAGDARYKRSLSNDADALVWVSVRRGGMPWGLIHRTLDAGRAAHRAVVGRR